MSARRVLTAKVRDGLSEIDSEMRATADTMEEDRPATAAAIRAALDWIENQVRRSDRQRTKATGEQA